MSRTSAPASGQRPPQSAEAYFYRDDGVGVDSVRQSARAVVPIVMAAVRPASVLDIGCGVGDWLREFLDAGVQTVTGLDGPWVPKPGLVIPADRFTHVDFHAGIPRQARHDLAMTLEVAEHLAPPVALALVDAVVNASDAVLWSAAVPGQGGHGHVNEQYQSHWIRVFAELGYAAFDLVRPHVWMDGRVSWWYQQNIFLFANATAQRALGLEAQPMIADLIHPALYERTRDPRGYSLKELVRHVPYYMRRLWARDSPYRTEGTS